MLKWLFILGIVTGWPSLQAQQAYSSADYIRVLRQATDVMINDVTSPVAAGRYYAYICITAQETQSLFTSTSLNGKLNGWKGTGIISKPESLQSSFPVLYSMYRMAGRLLPSGYLLNNPADSLVKDALQKGWSAESIQLARSAADSVVAVMMKYISTDHFRELSSMTRYTPLRNDAYWQPTAPGYMQALEPNWNKVRTLVLVSPDQFKPRRPAVYDTTRQSSFYKQLMEVYQIGSNPDKEQIEIASFWDCNPFALQQIGHVEFGLKKMSPGGHWMSITGIACAKAKKTLEQTILIHALVAISLHDAFVSCWDEKYRSNRVRPETAIRKLVDPKWKPLLQTPPFPEYTSGHSVISSAASVVLTAVFGGRFSFDDNSENEFGLATRSFPSFEAAASEAAVSRLYGGIHYRDAIEQGQVQGKKIGNHIVQSLKKYISLAK